MDDYKKALGHICESFKMVACAVIVFIWAIYKIGSITVSRITDSLTDDSPQA